MFAVLIDDTDHTHVFNVDHIQRIDVQGHTIYLLNNPYGIRLKDAAQMVKLRTELEEAGLVGPLSGAQWPVL